MLTVLSQVANVISSLADSVAECLALFDIMV